jgi:peptide/nickel transport system substrate-binding protein
MDHLTGDIWTMNPATYNYQMDWRPPEDLTGNLAADYEYTTPSTFVVHLRQGIHFQNIPPANGRELVASDVVANYDRIFGIGGGTISPSYSWYVQWQQLKSLTAPDNYTVVFQWGTSNTEFINELMDSADPSNAIECPEAVTEWGNLNDWHHAIGTGPFMVTDYVGGASATLVKNPNYFAYDERYPQNQLPYADGVSVLIIPNDATAVSAMRSGKIDIMYGMSNVQAQQLHNTNPDILQIAIPGSGAADCDIVPRNDKAPFNDVKVRQALQMAINLPDIAANYYDGTTPPDPSTLTSNYLTGWGFPYSEWPQDLKDQYAYNVDGAKALLTAAGYPKGFSADCVASNDWDLDLLQIVKDDFAAINVNMTIRSMDKVAFTNYVRVNRSENALSYGITDLGLGFEPGFQITDYVTGDSGNEGMVSDPTYDALYAKAVAETSLDGYKADLTSMNKEVAEQHFSISLLTTTTYAFCEPWLKGYNGQAFAADFAQDAPMWGGFYLSRFWVDQKLKTSK